MYCSGCGQQNDPNATNCIRCGRAMYASAPAAFIGGRVERHIRTVGILWLVYAGMGAIGWLVALPFMVGIFGHGFPMHHGMGFPFQGFHAFVPFITFFIFCRAALALLTGIALLNHARFGRILAIIVAILSLIKIPFGTALGIYTLWVLLPGESGYDYDRLATR